MNISLAITLIFASIFRRVSGKGMNPQDNPDGLIPFPSNLNATGELKLHLVNANGRHLISYDNIFLLPRSYISLNEDNNRVIYVNKNKQIFSLDLSAGPDFESKFIVDLRGKADFDFTASSDGKSIVLQTREFNGLYELKLIEFDEVLREWKDPRLIKWDYEVKLIHPTLKRDKQSVVYGKASYDFSEQLCEINLELEEGNSLDICADISKENPDVSLYSISPDAKMIIFKDLSSRTLQVVDYETRTPLSRPFRNLFYQIHKWTDDAIYLSFQRVFEDFSILYKLSMITGKLTRILNENGQPIPVLLDD